MTAVSTEVATEPDRQTLYYREGSSDKVYQVAIEPKLDGFVVTYAYGRRGSTLQTGCKTPTPIDHQTARKIFDALLQEKRSKGYTPGADGTPYAQSTESSRLTGVLPQLLNAIDESKVDPLLDDANWWTQEKQDGRRLLIMKAGDTLTGINRKGLTMAIPVPVLSLAQSLGGGQWLMDGEAMGDSFVAFDLLERACINLRNRPYRERLKALYEIVTNDTAQAIYAAETAMTTTGKRAMLQRLQAANREGLVFKRADSPYVHGRPNSGGDALKFKFVTSASCMVVGSQRRKRSVSLELLDHDAHIGVGNVTIPPNVSVPQAGAIVDVRYLYAYPGGSLYQPVFLSVRDDLTAEDCRLSQLKYKPTDD